MHIPIILIIEDDPGFNSILQKSLVQKGYKILSSVSVIEAKAKLRNQKFDCILLDLHLEGGSGESIISTIRGNKKDANFASPVIVMSGFLEPDVVKRIVPMVQGMLVKPFDPSALFKKIESILGGSPKPPEE